MRRLPRPLAVLVGAVAVIALSGCGGDDGDESPSPTPSATAAANLEPVSVLGIWIDEERASFEAMVAPWEGEMDFTGTRDLADVLPSRLQGADPPDVAIPAEVGLFRQFAREGRLAPLSDCPGLEDLVRSKYPQSYVNLATVDGVLYGFFMKADTKATVFYNPAYFESNEFEPLTETASFDDLIALSDAIAATGMHPWSMGQESGAGSGFPGSDTIQQILLNDAGPEIYDGIVDRAIAFNSPEMKAAWEEFGRIALTPGYVVQGDAPAIIAENFTDSMFPPFEDPPRAAMTHIGGFASGTIGEQFPDATPGEDFDFFPWPGGAITGGANIAYAFNSEPQTCSFMMHIAGAEAQQIWVERGGFTSLNTDVSLDAYPDEVAQRQARQLIAAETFRFDLDDAIGGDVQQAIFGGVLRYLADPASLDQVLAEIEAMRQ